MGVLETGVWTVDAVHPDAALLAEAGVLISQGKLVAFPTETVYGLGANALEPAAVNALCTAKGRPADNPLILHLASAEDLPYYVREIPGLAKDLIEAFWPGPLTLVFIGAGRLSRAVSGGLETIAVRVPAHPVALGVIRAAGVPVVAPSANISGKPSPVTAAHVLADLAGRIDVVLDGGPAPLGVESTVLDVTVKVPKVLRYGAVSAGEIVEIIGVVPEEAPGTKAKRLPSRSQTLFVLVKGASQPVAEEIMRLYVRFSAEGKKIGIIAREERAGCYPGTVIACGSAGDTWSVAAALYAAVQKLGDIDVILVEGVPGEIGTVVQRRLRQIASRVICVESGS